MLNQHLAAAIIRCNFDLENEAGETDTKCLRVGGNILKNIG